MTCKPFKPSFAPTTNSFVKPLRKVFRVPNAMIHELVIHKTSESEDFYKQLVSQRTSESEYPQGSHRTDI